MAGEITGARIVEVARSYLGVPYLHQGRSHNGMDCWGLLYAVGEEVELLPEDLDVPADYGPMADQRMPETIEKYCVKTDAMEAGVVALIRWPGSQRAGHMGILTADPHIIHSYSQVGKVVEHGFRGRWIKLLDSLWKLPGVTYG